MPGKYRFILAWRDIDVYEWVLPDPTRDVVEGKCRLRTFVVLFISVYALISFPFLLKAS
jgi:hypothetical protein